MEDVKFLKNFHTRLIQVHGLRTTEETRRFKEVTNRLYQEALRNNPSNPEVELGDG